MKKMEVYEDIDGQMTFSNINTNPTNYVVMANNLIMGRQNLSLQEFKLVRLIIMQIVANDLEFKPYEVSPADFARIIGNSDISNAYHMAKDLCSGLMTKTCEIISDDGSWVKYNWTSMSSYSAKTKKMQVQLNPMLKPMLLGLIEKGYYTQYTFDTIATLSSTYAARVLEMLLASIKTKKLPASGLKITLTKQQIIDGCMLYKCDKKGNIMTDPQTKKPLEKYARVSQFKEKVIQTACREINNKTIYYVPYTSEDGDPAHCVQDIKSGKNIVAFSFYINMFYHPGVPKMADARTVKLLPN